MLNSQIMPNLITLKQTRKSLYVSMISLWVVVSIIISGVVYQGVEMYFPLPIVVLLIVLIIPALVPLVSIRMDNDRVMVTKGSRVFDSAWRDIDHVGFNLHNNKPYRFFFIDNKGNKSALIEFNTLVFSDDKDMSCFDFLKFIESNYNVKVISDDYHMPNGYAKKKLFFAVPLFLLISAAFIYIMIMSNFDLRIVTMTLLILSGIVYRIYLRVKKV